MLKRALPRCGAALTSSSATSSFSSFSPAAPPGPSWWPCWTSPLARSPLLRSFSSVSSSSRPDRRKNTYGSNEYRRERYRRKVIAEHNAALEKQSRSVIPAMEPPLPRPSTTSSSSSSVDLGDESMSSAEALMTPTTCLGCGATFQTEFEHSAGFIHQSTIDQYMAQVQRRLAPHLHPQPAIHTSGEQQQTEEEEGQLPLEEKESATAVQNEEGEAVQEEEREVDAVNVADSSVTSDLSWQDSLRRCEVSMAELASSHSIHLLSPKQAKKEMRRLREVEDARWAARKAGAGAPYRPSTSVSPLPNPRPLRCVRCYQLSHYGHTRGNIATAISRDFRQLLQSRLMNPSSPSAVVILLVDVLDLHCSIIPHLQSIISRRHSLVIAANKVDLLPSDYGENRLRGWVKNECDRYGLHYQAVELVSAKTGEGLRSLMRKAQHLSDNPRDSSMGSRDFYLVGAVNTGKSSLLNKLQELRFVQKGEWSNEAALTSSILPGTTLGLVGFPLIPARDGTIYDTPGVIAHPMSTTLTMAELKAVLPSRPLVPVTYRLQEGQCILLGGLARIDHMEGRPFFFTVYVSHSVTVHVTNSKRMDLPVETKGDGQVDVETEPTPPTEVDTGLSRLFRSHAGSMVAPPFDFARFKELGLGRGPSLLFDLQGRGWMEAGEDIVFPGVGWVAVTGSGRLRVRTFIACSESLQGEEEEERALPFAREPLMPFDAKWTTRKFHGSDSRIKRHRQPSNIAQLHIQPQQQQQRALHTLSLFASRGSCRSFSTLSTSSLATRRRRSLPSIPSLSPPELSFAFATFTSSNSSWASSPSVSPRPSSSLRSSSSPTAASSSSSVMVPIPRVAVGRPQWSVYRVLLNQQRAEMRHQYMQTEEYLKRAKRSWEMQRDGQWLKRFRQRESDRKTTEGRYRRSIRARHERKRLKNSSSSSDESDHSAQQPQQQHEDEKREE